MQLGDDGIDLSAALAMPWQTVYTPERGPIQEGTQNWYGGVRDMTEDLVGALGGAEQTIRAHGYSGPITGEGITEVIPGEGQDIVRVHAAPHPLLLAWLKANGYTVKAAYPDSGRSSGFNYGSLWKDGKLVGVSKAPWSNKPGVIGYLVMGTLAAIAGGAALSAAGGASAGAGASAAPAAAAAPTAIAPTAAAVAPGAAAAAAAPSTAAAIGATVVKAAPAVISALAQVAKTNAETKAAEKQAQAVQEQTKALEVLQQQPSATMPTPQGSIFGPASQSGYMPVSQAYFDDRAQPRAAQPAKPPLPSWIVPAAIGAATLVLLPLLLNRKGARHAR